MIRIKNESDLKNWFKKNYMSLGFEKILRQDQMEFPDFVVLERGKRKRIELEINSSNFILHGHSIKKVDKVICLKNDINLGVPTVELKGFRVVGKLAKTHYSLENQIYKIFKKEKVVTSSEVAKYLKISWNTADSYLKELLIEGKTERIKKEGVTLWLKK